MTVTTLTLKQWINEIAHQLNDEIEPDIEQFIHFLHDPELVIRLVESMNDMSLEEANDELSSLYSAYIFAFDMCITQLQQESELGNKLAKKILSKLMSALADTINHSKHPLSFWLPILNAFYEVHVELTSELQDAYLNSACREDNISPGDEGVYLESIRDLINDLEDMSVFDIAENFFAQSYAMPADFFIDLIRDLYSIPEGPDIALLGLLHPKRDVRQVVLETLGQIIPHILLSSISLSRLKAISDWYPKDEQVYFKQWIIHQRKQGVTFSNEPRMPVFRIRASEIDGSGAQGIFIQLKNKRDNQLLGLLLKQSMGIKNAWITPLISSKEVTSYYHEVFDEQVVLRDIDAEYLLLITNHFLALTVERGDVPDLHLLAIQEALGLHFIPEKIDIDEMIQQLGISIVPFTPDSINQSLIKSASWLDTKPFAYSWYIENSQIDKLVNRCCHFVDGVKVCRFEEAMHEVLNEYMELHRDDLLFHFLWNALWIKVAARSQEKVWQDSYFIAYAIHVGTPLTAIPIIHEICRQSVANSIETMQDRKTYLNQE